MYLNFKTQSMKISKHDTNHRPLSFKTTNQQCYCGWDDSFLKNSVTFNFYKLILRQNVEFLLERKVVRKQFDFE
jgi:hypothetical protein